MRMILSSPLGDLLLQAEEGAVTHLDFVGTPGKEATSVQRVGKCPPHEMDGAPSAEDARLLQEAEAQLRAYFSGERRAFDLPLNPQGTPFQRACWAELCRIPYGTAVSYGVEAARIGRPTACRAVGAANGRNPIPILIPCHRVMCANGRLGGYSGGLAIKRYLLRLENIAYRE